MPKLTSAAKKLPAVMSHRTARAGMGAEPIEKPPKRRSAQVGTLYCLASGA